jgi:ferredoxin
MLVINPDECIDCGVCEPECPINAIEPDTNKNTEKYVILNKEMSAKWPNINKKKDPLPEADQFKNVSNKLEKYFSDKPGANNK